AKWIAGRGPQTTNARSRRSARVHPDNRAEREVDGRALAGLSAEPKGRRRSSIAATSRPRDPGHEAPTASRPPGSGQNRRSAHAQWPARSPGTPNPERVCSARRACVKSDRPHLALGAIVWVNWCRSTAPSQATREYLEAHGKPIAFYSDKHGVFRVNSAGAVQGDGMTQFGRSLHALNIDILCANTPQAKSLPQRRLGAASSAPTRPCRIAWSRNCAFRGSARLPPAMNCCRVSWLITMTASAK